MSQIILIEPNEDFNKLYSLNLTTYAGADIIDRANASDAIALLKILPQINLIITTPKVENEYTAVDLYKYIKKYELDIPMIVLGECKELVNEVLTLKNPIDWEILVKHACQLLGVSEDGMRKKVLQDYVVVDIKYFYEIAKTPCDVFIRIKKPNSEYEFVKRLHAEDSFDDEDIQKYEKKGLRDFYIARDYQQYFVNFVTNTLIQKLERKDIGIEDRLNMHSTSYEIVKERIADIGLDESIIDLASHSIRSMIGTIKESPKLGNLLKLLLSSRISYAYQHAHLVCVIGNFVMSKQKWYQEKHLDIFSYAAFFADITLKSVTQMRVNSNKEVKSANLTVPEKKQVETHALDAAELLQGTDFYTEYLHIVIMQHQGSESGVGFPENPSEQIHPIAKCFVVADAFVKAMLNPNGPRNKKDILSILYGQFTNPSYQNIIKVLEQKID